MSDFDYYYHTVDKARGSEVLDALRQSDDKTKAEAIDYLIDRGYLHSEEIYNAAYVNAMGDYLGLSDYDPDDWDEYNAPVGRGTKHSALDEVHQRLREAGKKRRQQRIAQARRMKQRKFEGHHGHHHAAEMEMTPDIMDYPGLPVVPDSYGTNSALDSGNGVPQWYGSAESNRGYGQLRYDARFDRDQTGEQDFLQNYYVRYTVYDIDNDKTYNDLPPAYKTVFNEMIKADIQSNFDTLWMDDDEDLREISGEIEYVGPLGEEVVISYEATLSIPQILSEKVYPNMSQSSYEFGVNFKGENLRGKDSVVTTTSWKPSKGKKNMEHRFTPSRAFMDYAKVTKEAPFAGAGSLFKFGGNDSALGGFTAKELTESSAIHGDFDHASLNYSGHQNIEARAEGDGEVSERVYIRFSWETPSEYDRIIDEYTITDNVYDEVYQEVQNGNYSGVGSWTYYYDQEDDDGNTHESEIEVEYQWG